MRLLAILPVAAVAAVLCTALLTATSSPLEPFLVTNDDSTRPFPPSTMAFYGIAPDGGLSRPVTVETAGVGVGGGYFGLARVLVVPGGQDACVYASNAQSGDIVSMPAGQRKLAGNFRGSPADTVPAPNGIGLAVSARYLYASFAGSGNIGTFEIQPGCKLRFLGDVHVKGLHGGQVECMAVHADIMVAAYGDGSIESFHVGGGPPGSNHDAQDATGYRDDHRPGAVDITQDGRYAIFGDASTVTTVEVSDMSAGKLAPTVVYNLGPAWNSGGVRLSPDESVLYVSNSSGGRVTAAFFDKTTGKLRSGCTSLPLKGFPAQFAYAGGVATQLATGTGGLLYVPEFATGRQSYIGMLRFAAAQDGCTLTETADSPVAGTHISALLSIAVYPPRPF